jgi:hypothetical protein
MKKITTVDCFKISTYNWLLRFDLKTYFDAINIFRNKRQRRGINFVSFIMLCCGQYISELLKRFRIFYCVLVHYK